MQYTVKYLGVLIRVFTTLLAIAEVVKCNDVRNLQNHRNGILNLKDVANHWIGLPKSPYTSFTVTASPTTSTSVPTSAPVSVSKTTKQKKKKHKKVSNNKRRSDLDDSSDYKEMYRNREKFAYQDFDYDYDGEINTPYSNSYSSSPYIIRTSSSTPKAIMVNPSLSTSSQTLKAIYAGTPKVATYVVPNTKKYIVKRVKSEALYIPPSSVPPNPRMYAEASNSGMRRLDPLDYEDGNNGGGTFLNLGPQDSFPPRTVMNKIVQPGQRQPCHGPDCHQHHKGLVRFYWRRVVYPPGRGRQRRPVRGRTRRRRLRNRSRAPSDQTDVYAEDDEEAEETEEDTNAYNNDGDIEEDEDNEENDSSRRNVWQPGRAYGHDIGEGNNYDEQDKRTYRDKRYAYRKRKRGSFQ